MVYKPAFISGSYDAADIIDLCDENWSSIKRFALKVTLAEHRIPE